MRSADSSDRMSDRPESPCRVEGRRIIVDPDLGGVVT